MKTVLSVDVAKIYPCSVNLKYYCIQEREVSEFVKYSEEKEVKKEKDKIVFFKILKKLLTLKF